MSSAPVEPAAGYSMKGVLSAASANQMAELNAYAASQKTGEVLMLPIAGNKIVLLDTGVALNPNGRLTAFCADHHSFIQVDHYAKVVEVAR